MRVEQGGAYANLALDAALQSAGAMDRRDAALATELVYGTLRRRLALDHALDPHSRRPLAELDPALREALRLGAYQLLYLDQVPAHAAVDASVELVKTTAPRGAEKYANAVLRSLARAPEKLRLPREEEDPIAHWSIAESHPRWLVERLWARLGREETIAFLRADNQPAPSALRARLGRASPEMLVRQLQEDGLAALSSLVAPQGVRMQGGSALATRAWREGRCTVQDEAAQLVGHLCAPAPGSRILDVCAAPGGKTTHLAELAGEAARILAVDVSAKKLEVVREAALRLGLANIEVLAADARRPYPGVEKGSFDLVLVDAPCSGTGTLRRHPELRWRRNPADVGRLCDVQREILSTAADYVQPGGILVYAVCSILAEEGPAQVDRLLAARPDCAWAGRPLGSPLGLAERADERGVLETWPHRGGLDGFWAARLRRRDV